ncbi:MAG: glycoprotein [Wufeng shrew rhabdovirus 5]|nr:MAG: glycoprotein [Wufeng shrew rhabdovirus 5]
MVIKLCCYYFILFYLITTCSSGNTTNETKVIKKAIGMLFYPWSPVNVSSSPIIAPLTDYLKLGKAGRPLLSTMLILTPQLKNSMIRLPGEWLPFNDTESSKFLNSLPQVRQLKKNCVKLCSLTPYKFVKGGPRNVSLTPYHPVCYPYTLGACPEVSSLYNRNALPVMIWNSTRLLKVKKPDLHTERRFISQASTPSFFLRGKRGAVSLKCPPLSQFKKINPSRLRCSDIEKKLTQTTAGTIKWLPPNIVHYPSVACLCTTYRVDRYCFTNFFGPKEYKEEVFLEKSDDSENCLWACDQMFLASATSYINNKVPNYDCFWLQTKKTTGRKFVAEMSNIMIHGPSKVVSGASISSSISCVYVNRGSCLGVGTPRVYFPKNFEDTLPILEEKILEVEVRAIDGSNISAVTVPGLGSVFIDRSCKIVYLGQWYHQAGDGTLWGTGSAFHVFDKPLCTTLSSHNLKPTFFDPIYDDLPTLRRELINCYSRRQILINSLTLHVEIDPLVLQGLSYDDASTFSLYPHPTGVYGAACQSVEYDGLVWASHDVWLVYNTGVLIGCLDARLKMVLMDCVHYNETKIFEIDSQWDVQLVDGKYEARLKPGESLLISILYDVSDSISEYLDSLVTPPAYPPSTGAPTGHPEDFDPSTPNGETTSSPFDWFLNLSLFGRIGTVFGILLGVVAIVISIVLICRCASNGNC